MSWQIESIGRRLEPANGDTPRAIVTFKSRPRWSLTYIALGGTDTDPAPWYVADSNDKPRARLNVISHILNLVPYKNEKAAHVVLPDRQKKDGYRDPDVHRHLVPMRF